jgi:hypothetical protein
MATLRPPYSINQEAGAAVTRVGRAADGAVAANGGHAHGRAAPQHGQRGFHRFAGLVPVACGGRASALVTST